MKKILIANKNLFFKKKFKNSKKVKFFFISNKRNFNLKNIKKINPNLIFFPHWSYKVENKIIENFKCIGFHSTPLPYGRGGSPIQNMVLRGFKNTKVCCFNLTKNLDDGDIYFSYRLNLNGTANEIFLNLYNLIFKMIKKFIKKKYIPKSQKGKILIFKRRNKNESLIEKKINLKKLYDKIRILDYDEKEFPKAFIKHGKLKIIFL